MKPITNGTKSGMQDPLTGRFIEGNAGGGRPPGVKNFTTKVREALERIAEGKDYTYEEAFIKSILKGAIVDGKESTQKLIWNYLDGLPAQHNSLDIMSGGEKIGGFNFIPANENNNTNNSANS